MKEKQRKATGILVLAVLFIAALCAFLLRNRRAGADSGLIVRIEVNGREILRSAPDADLRYAVIDGEAVLISETDTIASLAGTGEAESPDINIIEIHDGTVACVASNCKNQICVHTAPLTGEAHDMPIVCLPHGMFVFLEEE